MPAAWASFFPFLFPPTYHRVPPPRAIWTVSSGLAAWKNNTLEAIGKQPFPLAAAKLSDSVDAHRGACLARFYASLLRDVVTLLHWYRLLRSLYRAATLLAASCL